MKISGAYVGATYMALLVGILGFCMGLFNATMALNEKGYYFTLLAFGLYASISVQKNVRDMEEGQDVSSTYIGLSYGAVLLSLILLAVGLMNASLTLSEKGFYGIAFVLALFSAVTVQKNIRDKRVLDSLDSRERD